MRRACFKLTDPRCIFSQATRSENESREHSLEPAHPNYKTAIRFLGTTRSTGVKRPRDSKQADGQTKATLQTQITDISNSQTNTQNMQTH